MITITQLVRRKRHDYMVVAQSDTRSFRRSIPWHWAKAIRAKVKVIAALGWTPGGAPVIERRVSFAEFIGIEGIGWRSFPAVDNVFLTKFHKESWASVLHANWELEFGLFENETEDEPPDPVKLVPKCWHCRTIAEDGDS
jgi:hypothetical protein